jgi:hypothetical protein
MFREVTKTALGTQPCGPGKTEGCYTNYVVVADLDADGALDLVFANGGDHFVPGDAVKSAIYFGDGKGGFRDGSSQLQGLAASHVRQAAVGDVDGDGRLDIYMPGGYGLDADQLFIQRSDHTFVDEARARLDGRRSHAGGTHLGDIDRDGDLDLLVIDWGAQPNPDDEKHPATPVAIDVLENDGSGKFSHVARLDAPGGTSATDVQLVDINGDFELDIVHDNRNGQARVFINDGAGHFVDTTDESGIPPKEQAISFNAEACDLDADGDLDLMFDGAESGTPDHDTQVLVNDGKGHFTDETTKRIAKEPVSDDNQVKCADVDGDGRLDLLVASLSNPSEKLFLNNGKGGFTDASARMPRITDPTLGIDVGDFDSDGALDVVTAQGEDRNFPWLNRIYLSTSGVKDTRPPVFRALEQPKPSAGKPFVLRAAIYDAYTSQTGQALRDVRAHLSGAGGARDVPMRFVGGDLFQLALPAIASGGQLTVTLDATDRAGNKATSKAITVSVP